MRRETRMMFVGSSRAVPEAPIGSTVLIHGIPCEKVSDERAELAEMVICVDVTRPLLLPDNKTGPCADCGTALQWRPHAPVNPPKVCLLCATERVAR